MYKEPLMIDKYEALQELYLKDPLKPLQVSVIEFFEQRVGEEEEGEGVEEEKEKKENENERIVVDTGGRKDLLRGNWRGMGVQERKVRERQ